MSRKRWHRRVLPLLGIALLLLGWQIVGTRLNPIFLSTPTRVVTEVSYVLNEGDLLYNAWMTLWTFALGLSLGMLVGAPVGIILGRFQLLGMTATAVVRLLYSIPVIALFPLFLVWFGPGNSFRVFVIFTAACLPVIISSKAGAESVDQSLLEVGRVFGAQEREVLLKLVVPATVPFVAAGFQVAIGRAMVTTVAVEILTAQDGLGGMMSFYGNQFQTARYFVPLVTAGLLSLFMYWIGDVVERHFSRWKVV